MGKQAVHGGASFDAIGSRLRSLERKDEVVNADVLDAWYDPTPRAVEAIREHLPWLIRTSPPTHGEGLRETIAETRGVDPASVLLGSGTSSLMFLAFPRLLGPGERALILDPMYGEYAHLIEHVAGGQLARFPLDVGDFRPDPRALARAAEGAKLLVVVNPNSPTGVALRRADMEALLAELPTETRLWVDETYIDFLPGAESVEPLVARDRRLIVSKSMSKFYALSGLRIGYLVAEPDWVTAMETLSPPWSVGLIAQLAGIEALLDPGYYAARAAETRALRDDFAARLGGLPGVRAVPSDANFLLLELNGHSARALDERMRAAGVFIRNCDSLSPRFSDDHIRIAVKDEATNERIVRALEAALGG